MSTPKHQQSKQQSQTVNKSPKNINDLPNELLQYIFEQLNIKDVNQCRSVCKRFLAICAEVKIEELIIIGQKIQNVNDHMFGTNELFNSMDAIDVTTFMACRSKFRFETCVKRFNFSGTIADYERLNVNSLTQIEQLTIDCGRYIYDERVIDINLPNLKVLNDYCTQDFELRLNTPKLDKLRCYSFRPIHIHHPHSIKYLDLNGFYDKSVASLMNLQYLNVSSGFENIRLSAHPELSTLIFDSHRGIRDQYETIDDESTESMDAIRRIVKERRSSSQLRIYFKSVRTDNVEKIDEYENTHDQLKFQIDNYDLLCDDVYLDYLEYNELMRLVKGTLPNDFFQKYSKIEFVAVTGNVENQDHLVGFLKRLKFLKTLHLDASFDQRFYDCLPEIESLTLLDVQESVKSITNYEFLFKLNRLESFMTDRDSRDCFELTLALFRQLRCLGSVDFCYEGEYIAISRFLPDRYYVDRDSEDTLKMAMFRKGMNFDELSAAFSSIVGSK